MKKIRLALSGSGTKAPAHVGAILAIQEAGFEIVELAGTSGGALCCALLACGMTPGAMEDMVLGMDWRPLMAGSLFNLIRGRSYSAGNGLLEFMRTRTGGKKFGDLGVDLTIYSADLSSEGPHVFSTKRTPDVEVALAARASASIPLYFEPVRIGDAVLVDGGLVSNLPIDALTIDEVPRLGIELTAKPLALQSTSIVSLAPRLVDLMIQSTEDAHISIGRASGATVAQVDTGFASSLDSNMDRRTRELLLLNGFSAATEALRRIDAEIGYAE